eukprot:scaffold45800_cov32-Prasinocladus_malaysianus.AAC.2
MRFQSYCKRPSCWFAPAFTRHSHWTRSPNHLVAVRRAARHPLQRADGPACAGRQAVDELWFGFQVRPDRHDAVGREPCGEEGPLIVCRPGQLLHLPARRRAQDLANQHGRPVLRKETAGAESHRTTITSKSTKESPSMAPTTSIWRGGWCGCERNTLRTQHLKHAS